jgi:hypothetical protein
MLFADLGQISSEEEGNEVEGTLVEGADDQQAAEAMVQLGNFGFFANPQQGAIIVPKIRQWFSMSCFQMKALMWTRNTIRQTS